MFHRMVNPRRVLMVFASARKTVNPQDHIIYRNSCPHIRQARTLLQVFPPRNYCSVAEAEVADTNQVVNILKENEWCHEIVEKINGISDISGDDFVSALKTLNPEKALSFFEWYKKTRSYKPSSSVYNAMLRAVGKKNHVQNFWELAEEMKEEGFDIEEHTLMFFSVSCRASQMNGQLAKFFIWMAENGKEKPSANCCSRVLNYLSSDKIPDSDTVYRVVEAYKNCGGTMEKFLYDGLHRCLTKAGRFDEAEKIMCTMTKEGFFPDNITYSQLIYGLCNANRLEHASQIVNQMKENGCYPDLKTWTVLIKWHCFANQTDKALAFFSEMVQSGCNADSEIIQDVVPHLCLKNRPMDAYNLMRNAIVEQKIKPSLVSYVEIIKSLSQSEMLKEACEMLDHMKGHGYIPFAKPVYELISKNGSVEDAYKFLTKGGLSAGRCATMFSAFCNMGRQRDAHHLLSRFPPRISKSGVVFRVTKITSKKGENKFIEAKKDSSNDQSSTQRVDQQRNPSDVQNTKLQSDFFQKPL